MAWHSTWNEPPRRPRWGFLADRGGFFPPGVKLVLVVTVAVFFLEILYMQPLLEWGAVTVRGILHFQVWRLVTYMFLHGSTDHILINMFIFVMLGVAFERQIGTRQFLAMYLVAGIVGGLFEVAFNALMYWKYGSASLGAAGHTFLDVPAVGASAGVAGVLVAFAVLNPRAIFLLMFIIPIQARWIALLYVLVETRHVFMGLLHGWTGNVANAAHLGGMALGFVWMKWGPWLAGALRRGVRRRRPRVPERSEAEQQAELDRILDKIRQAGLDSLSIREKMFLQETAKKFRGP